MKRKTFIRGLLRDGCIEAFLKTQATKLNGDEEKAVAEKGIDDYANLTG